MFSIYLNILILFYILLSFQRYSAYMFVFLYYSFLYISKYYILLCISSSYYGANQLLLDFGCFKEWITRLDPQYLDSDTVSIILANNSFEEFSSAIKLLCCQPESRRRSNTGSVSDTDGTSSVGSTTSHGV